jgi:hypothetical protein
MGSLRFAVSASPKDGAFVVVAADASPGSGPTERVF